MNATVHRGHSSTCEETDTAVQSSAFTASEAAFDAAFLRLQAEVDHEPDVELMQPSNLDSRAPLVALLHAAAEKIITLIVEADQVSHAISNAISGQTWGEADSEARKAVGKLRRDFRMRPFSKIESRMEVSCKCLVSALEEEPKQHVMWYEADRGAPTFQEGREMDREMLTILMDAATDRLKIIQWDVRTMQAELTRSAQADPINDVDRNQQSETVT